MKPTHKPNHKGFRRHVKLELKQGHYEDLPEVPHVTKVEDDQEEPLYRKAR